MRSLIFAVLGSILAELGVADLISKRQCSAYATCQDFFGFGKEISSWKFDCAHHLKY